MRLRSFHLQHSKRFSKLQNFDYRMKKLLSVNFVIIYKHLDYITYYQIYLTYFHHQRFKHWWNSSNTWCLPAWFTVQSGVYTEMLFSKFIFSRKHNTMCEWNIFPINQNHDIRKVYVVRWTIYWAINLKWNLSLHTELQRHPARREGATVAVPRRKGLFDRNPQLTVIVQQGSERDVGINRFYLAFLNFHWIL